MTRAPESISSTIQARICLYKNISDCFRGILEGLQDSISRGAGMAEENGEKKSTGLLDRVRQDITDLKDTIKEKGKEEIEGLKEPEKTQVFRSIFRVKHDETPRNRALSVLSNVFFHLHPAKVNRDAVKYKFTWGMGGITFYLFIVLTFTGVLLMFYYHPSKVQAFRDILYLENDVPFGKLLRNMHRWAAHLMIIAVWLHMFRVFLTGSYKRPREFNWCIGVLLMVLDAAPLVHRIPAARRSTGLLGGDRGNQHGQGDALVRNGRAVRRAPGHDAVQRRAFCACSADRSSMPMRSCAPTSGIASRFL